MPFFGELTVLPLDRLFYKIYCLLFNQKYRWDAARWHSHWCRSVCIRVCVCYQWMKWNLHVKRVQNLTNTTIQWEIMGTREREGRRETMRLWGPKTTKCIVTQVNVLILSRFWALFSFFYSLFVLCRFAAVCYKVAHKA